MQIVSEVGTYLTRWATEKYFTARMRLAPGSHQSGKRKGSVKRHRVGRLFVPDGRALACSKDIALGCLYRRMAAR